MNNQVNVMIAGADMGGLIASCALHYDFQNRLLQEDRFRISRLEKDTLTMEDVEQCDLSGVEYVVNATLHDTEARLPSMRNARSRAFLSSMPSTLARQLSSPWKNRKAILSAR